MEPYPRLTRWIKRFSHKIGSIPNYSLRKQHEEIRWNVGLEIPSYCSDSQLSQGSRQLKDKARKYAQRNLLEEKGVDASSSSATTKTRIVSQRL
ncbi:hypothetical protein Ddc_05254 [Ditylenchus destructor]|nr:hypothetical protein Ddc_05254 [Ditylenchus destructor]